jgi:hypothetical protein
MGRLVPRINAAAGTERHPPDQDGFGLPRGAGWAPPTEWDEPRQVERSPDRRLSRTSSPASALVGRPVMMTDSGPCPRPRLKGDTGRAKPHWQATRGTTLPPRPGTMGNAVAAWEFAWRR